MAEELNPSTNLSAATARDAAGPSLQTDGAGRRKRDRESAGLDDENELAAVHDARQQRLEAELAAAFDELVPDPELPHESRAASSSPEIWNDAASDASDEENRSPPGTVGVEAGELSGERSRGPRLDVSDEYGAGGFETPNRAPLTPESMGAPTAVPNFTIWSDPVSGGEASTATSPSIGPDSAKTDPALPWESPGSLNKVDVFGEHGVAFDAETYGSPQLTFEASTAPEIEKSVDQLLEAARAQLLAPLAEEWEETRQQKLREHETQINAEEENFSRDFPGMDAKSIFDQRRAETERDLWREMKMDARIAEVLAPAEAHFKRQAEQLRKEVDVNNSYVDGFKKYYGIEPESLIDTDFVETQKDLDEIGASNKNLEDKNSRYFYGKSIQPEHSEPSHSESSKKDAARRAVDADSLRDLLREYQRSDLHRHTAVKASLEQERLAGQAELKRAMGLKPRMPAHERDALIAGETARMERIAQEDWSKYSSAGHPIRFMEATLREERMAWDKGLQKDVQEMRKAHRAAHPTLSEYKRRKEFNEFRQEFEARHEAAMGADGYTAMNIVAEQTMRQHGVDEQTIREALLPTRSATEALATGATAVSHSHSHDSREDEREHERDRQHSSASR